ncbi:hypothetical protein DL93DRAFT_2073665 [Clavulina sp. PMI_390]|nr:hypothetical protein DL93DRAFT_2073665 [Clavulina sp. PMI_390]
MYHTILAAILPFVLAGAAQIQCYNIVDLSSSQPFCLKPDRSSADIVALFEGFFPWIKPAKFSASDTQEPSWSQSSVVLEMKRRSREQEVQSDSGSSS